MRSTSAKRYRIKFSSTESQSLASSAVTFQLEEDGETRSLRFHDYGELYKRPGLYEQLFYDRLKCTSPDKICEVLTKVLRNSRTEMSELRVLDLGAGNGMVGEKLFSAGVSRLIGIDIDQEAQAACERDRPGVYDAYHIADLCDLSGDFEAELRSWQLDCMVCVAALGFGDIPTRAFINAFNLVKSEGWIVFNIKETFLQESDRSGFSRLVKSLLLTDTLEVHHLERYRHRLSVDGHPLYYYVLAGKKQADIPASEAFDDEAASDVESRSSSPSSSTMLLKPSTSSAH